MLRQLGEVSPRWTQPLATPDPSAGSTLDIPICRDFDGSDGVEASSGTPLELGVGTIASAWRGWPLPDPQLRHYPEHMDQEREIELVFAPQEEGGYHVYAPDLPGLHTQGDTLEEATVNAQEALDLYVEGLREDGRPLDAGVIRRKFPVPA